jgi:hypothetical protein
MNSYVIAVACFCIDLFAFSLINSFIIQSTLVHFVLHLFSKQRKIVTLIFILFCYCIEFLVISGRTGLPLITLIPLSFIMLRYESFLKDYPLVLCTLFLTEYFAIQSGIISFIIEKKTILTLYTLQPFCVNLIMIISYLKYTHWRAARQSLKVYKKL